MAQFVVFFLLMAAAAVLPMTTTSSTDDILLVNGDKDLPFRLCEQFKRPGESDHFAFCMECLNADPRSSEVDVCGLTSTLLGCAISSTERGTNIASDLQRSAAAVEEPLKRALAGCQSSLQEARLLVQTSSEFFRDRDFSKAWHNVDGARTVGYDVCLAGFGQSPPSGPGPVPAELNKELTRFGDLCQDTVTIISDFAGGSKVPCND